MKNFLGNDYIKEMTECSVNIEDETADVLAAIDDFRSGNAVGAI